MLCIESIGRTQAPQSTSAHALGLRRIGRDAGDLMAPGIHLVLLWAPKEKAESAALRQRP